MTDTDSTATDKQDGRTPKQKLIDNEQARLLATALNNLAVAALVAAVVGPTAADLYGITVPKSPYWVGFALCWVAGSFTLHAIARRTLKDLTS